MDFTEFQEQLNRIEAGTLANKKVLTFEEAASYMGVSKSHLYKLTAGKKIDHFKPKGKMVYFDRVELETYLLQSPVKTISDNQNLTVTKVLTSNKGGKI